MSVEFTYKRDGAGIAVACYRHDCAGAWVGRGCIVWEQLRLW